MAAAGGLVSRLTKPLTTRAKDPDVDRMLRNLAQCIRELQASPAVSGVLIPDIELENGVRTPIAHGLGRPVRVFWSPPRGSTSAGRIRERRGLQSDRNNYVDLQADGYGATVTVDLWVM